MSSSYDDDNVSIKPHNNIYHYDRHHHHHHPFDWNILNIDECASLFSMVENVSRPKRKFVSSSKTTEIQNFKMNSTYSRQIDRFELFVLKQDPSHLVEVTGGTFDLPEKKRPAKVLNAFGQDIFIEQGFSDISKGHSELIWKASLRLPEFFERHSDKISLKGKRVLELGSGTGSCGICIAASGAHVFLTDQDRALPLLYKNRDRNMERVPGTISVRALSWGFEPHHRDLPKFDLIVASDCLYSNAAWTWFQDTLHWVMLKNPSCVAYVCNDGRWDHRFFEALNTRFEFVVLDEMNADPIPLPSTISSRLLIVRVTLKRK